MCELLAISARFPTTISLSFEELARHGGCDRPHHDGWGVAFVRERDALLIKEPQPAAHSLMARFVAQAQIESTTVVSHIRKATLGGNRFENTHPFSRELGGRAHVFAHNGSVAPIKGVDLGSFRPHGDTDSEHAFCVLLSRLAPLWRDGKVPELRHRAQVVAEFAAELRAVGIANFLYADTDALFVHAHRRPKHDDDEPDAPGLHVLERSCAVELGSVQAAEVSARSQWVYLAATVPLSDEPWRPMEVAELAVIQGGQRCTWAP